MQEQGFKWYAMRAVSGKEAKLKEYIEKEIRGFGDKVLVFALVPEHITGKRVKEA